MAARLHIEMAYFMSFALNSGGLEETLLALEEGLDDMVSGTSLVSVFPECFLIVTLVSEERGDSSKDTCFLRLDKLWLELFKLLRLLPGDKDKVNC